MVFAHSVPSKWPLYKATPHPTNPLEPAPYIQFILYYIYIFIFILSPVFFQPIFWCLIYPWMLRKTLKFASWITGNSSPAKLGVSTRWQQKPHPGFLSQGHVFQKKKENFVPLSSTTADLVRFSRSSWEDTLPKESNTAVIDRLSMSSICSVLLKMSQHGAKSTAKKLLMNFRTLFPTPHISFFL